MRGVYGARPWHRRSIGAAGIGVALLVGTLTGSGCGSRTALAGRAVRTVPTAAYNWTRSAADALDLGGGPTSTLGTVTAPDRPGADWLIAGTRTAADGTTIATVWSSPSGVGWVATALAGMDGRALAATAWGERTVIVGSVGIGATQRAAVWISPGPGRPFGLVPGGAALLPTAGPGTAGGGTATMDVVAAGTQGVFATGVRSGRPAAWYSTDGADWVDLTGATRALDAGAGAVVTSMLVTSTAVLAAGTVQDGSHRDGAVWTSPDGINWHREVPADNPFSGPADHRIEGLALTSTGAVVAVGGVRSGPAWLPVSWISPDGNIWSQPSEALPTATRSQPVEGGTIVRAVTATGSSLVAVGGSSTAQRLWVSTDGQSWTEAPLPGGAARAADWSADAVAEAGPTTVIVDTGPGQPRVLVRDHGAWREVSARASIFGPVAPVATPAALVTDGRQLVLAVDIERPGPSVGASTRSSVVLSSTDGTHWRRLSDPDTLSGAWVDSMDVMAGSLVAAGTTTTVAGRPAGAVWTSLTGQRWRQAASFATGSRAPGAATATAARGSTLLAFGSAPDPAAGTKPGVDAVPTAQAWSLSRAAATGGSTELDRPTGTDLDAVAGVGPETVLGSCSNGGTIVVVGAALRRGLPPGLLPATTKSKALKDRDTTTSSVATSGSPTGAAGQATDGTMAVTWASLPEGPWSAGTVDPLGGAGGDERMDGCAAVDTGFVAWGQTAGPGGGAVPALWTSPDGEAWTLQRISTLDVAGAAPLTAVAASGSAWVAVGGGQPAALATPWSPGSGLDDPDPPAPASSATSGADGGAAVLSSSDAGTTWARLATTAAAWAATGRVATDLVRPLGSTLIVAGTVDSRLAVWVGAPTTSE
jgi:hypothetical protein